ncbi:NineTeen Complex (NTC) component, partial [Coemansia sp. BCRC 34490]
MADENASSRPGGYGQSGQAPKIKNKNAAAVQITAEQLIREAYSRQGTTQKAPRQKVLDGEELSDYQMRRRREFEEGVRRNRSNIGEWLRYAAWEEGQGEVGRARSVYERALDVDGRNQTVFIKYAELEMKNKNIALARNLYDRAVTTLPRVAQFWQRYTYMEELLGNIAGAREVFARWMRWEPEEAAWVAFIRFETRYGEIGNARALWERAVDVHPEPRVWLKWARFEEDRGDAESARRVFGLAIDRLGESFMDQHVFISFARFETRLREYDRARAIYRYALERLPRAKSHALHSQYAAFEKQHGAARDIEDVVATKRRLHYEALVRANPADYDAWLDYAALEEEAGDVERTRDVYERAIAEYPGVAEKRLWRRYIYLWLFYALFEETRAQDVGRARAVYVACIELVPHAEFTFAKLWLQYAWFEIRSSGDLRAARRALGRAIGQSPAKDKLFRGYIELELELREFDRVRTLYAKFLEANPTSCSTWVEFARLEAALGEADRCLALFELAVEQPTLDMPELLWKAYIDFVFDSGDFQKTRALYERLLAMTDHVKVWISFARFELLAAAANDESAGAGESSENFPGGHIASGAEAARAVYERAYARMKALGLKEERLVLLEAWRDSEQDAAGGDPAAVEKRMPKRVRKRRELDDGSLEEYFDYVFPDDEEQGSRFKLLAKAH